MQLTQDSKLFLTPIGSNNKKAFDSADTCEDFEVLNKSLIKLYRSKIEDLKLNIALLKRLRERKAQIKLVDEGKDMITKTVLFKNYLIMKREDIKQKLQAHIRQTPAKEKKLAFFNKSVESGTKKLNRRMNKNGFKNECPMRYLSEQISLQELREMGNQ